jgi:hypothetical protein
MSDEGVKPERFPRIRARSPGGSRLVREGLSFIFYLRHPHNALVPAVTRSLEAYLRAIGPNALGWYANEEGEYRKLDTEGCAQIHRDLHAEEWAIVQLYDADLSELRYRFEYFARELVDLAGRDDPDEVSTVSFWLPSEFLEEHGPSRVRALALELAAPLPFCSAYAGLAFNSDLDLPGAAEEIARHCFRYPGMDISARQWKLGTRLWGVQWLTFLGQPVLGELGGPEGLRARLSEPGTTVQEMEGKRAVVTLGARPEAGDTEQGQVLPAYRELAHILEPWLYQGERVLHFSHEQERRWVRRFLD